MFSLMYFVYLMFQLTISFEKLKVIKVHGNFGITKSRSNRNLTFHMLYQVEVLTFRLRNEIESIDIITDSIIIKLLH